MVVKLYNNLLFLSTARYNPYRALREMGALDGKCNIELVVAKWDIVLAQPPHENSVTEKKCGSMAEKRGLSHEVCTRESHARLGVTIPFNFQGPYDHRIHTDGKYILYFQTMQNC